MYMKIHDLPFLVFGAACVIASSCADAQTVRYVDSAAKQGGSGLSWSSPHQTIYQAVAAAQPGDEIWVREGLYKVDAGTIDLSDDLVLRGSFLGDETHISQRNIGAHPTLITADLLGNDTDEFSSRADNTSVTLIAGGALLDGVVIRGAARQAVDRVASMVDCTVEDCLLITGEESVVYLLASQGDSLSVERCVFLHCARETEDIREGVLEIRALESANQVLVRDCMFLNNGFAGNGTATGLIVTASSNRQDLRTEVFIEQCQFIGNTSESRYPCALGIDVNTWDVVISDSQFNSNIGNGQHNSPVYIEARNSKLSIRDSYFTENVARAASSSALTLHYNANEAWDYSATIERCVFSGNTSAEYGSLYVQRSDAVEFALRDCEFINNSGTRGAAATFFESRVLYKTLIDNVLFDGNSSPATGSLESSVLYAEDAVVVGSQFINHDSIDLAVDGGFDLSLVSCIVRNNSFARLASDPGPCFVHSVVWNNYSPGGAASSANNCDFINCVLDVAPEDQMYSAEHCVFPGAADANGNLSLDSVGQIFLDPDNGNFRPVPGSALIDAGTLKWRYPEWIYYTLDYPDLDHDGVRSEFLPIDLDGTARNQDDPATPGSGPDIGLYEIGNAAPNTSPCLPDV